VECGFWAEAGGVHVVGTTGVTHLHKEMVEVKLEETALKLKTFGGRPGTGGTCSVLRSCCPDK
jgi:hypothetical protein